MENYPICVEAHLKYTTANNAANIEAAGDCLDLKVYTLYLYCAAFK